jgi:hypothetical protein
MFPINKDIYTIDLEVKPLPQYVEKYNPKKQEESEEDGVQVDNANFFPWCSEIYGLSISWGYEYEDTAYFTGNDIEKVVDILSDNKLKLGAHNVFFDWSNLAYKFNKPLNFVTDSGVISQCINNSDFINSFGLKQTTQRQYNIETQDFEIKSYLKTNFKIPESQYGAYIHLCPSEMIEKYCRLDSMHCWRLIHDAHKWIKSDISQYMALYINEVELTIIQFIEGILVNRDGFKREREKLLNEIDVIESKFLNNEELIPFITKVQKDKFDKAQAKLKKKILNFDEWSLTNKFNINSSDQLKQLFDYQGLHFNREKNKFEYPYVNTVPGTRINNPNSPKLGTKFLYLYGVGGEILADKSEKVTLASHMEHALDESELTGKIHPHINLLGTKSGRISASGVNIVAVPVSEKVYGENLIIENGWTIFSTDFCYHPDTEYLTPYGWKKVLELQENEFVWEVKPDSLEGNFTQPKRIIKKYYEGDMYEYNSGQSRGSLVVTENHSMFWIGQQTHKRKDKAKYRYWTLSQEGVPTKGCNIGTFSYSNTYSSFQELDIWRITAIQADGSLLDYGEDNYVIQVNIPRKVEKLTELFGPPIHINKEIRKGQNYLSHTWRIKFAHPLLKSGKDKLFNLKFLGNNQVEQFFEALVFWDGGFKGQQKYNTGRFSYYTTELKNAESVQIFAVTNGFEARLSVITKQSERHKNCYSVSIKKRGTIRFQPNEELSTCKINKYFYKGEVGCVTVNTGLILVRHKGQTFLSGNCSLEPCILACLSDDPVLKYTTFEGQGKKPFIKDGILFIDDNYISSAYSAPFMRPEIEDNLDFDNWVIDPDAEKKKIKTIRGIAKTTVLSTNYGAGALKVQGKIREDMKITVPLKNIQEFQEAYWATFIVAAQYKRAIEREAQEKGYLINIGGYPLTFYDRPGGIVKGAHKALNRMIQSSAAVVMKLFLFYFYRRVRNKYYIRPQVSDWHDAHWGKCKIDAIEEVKFIIKESLEELNTTLNLPLKFRLDFNYGSNFYQAKG